jgi:serine/threonine-protein kinase
MAQGGMAEVYRAFQPGVERYVAIKVLHSHLAEAENFVARFHREARAIGRLQHPHIVRIMEVGNEGEHDYIVMEFVQGGTIGAALKIAGKLPACEVLQIGAQLADALRSAHAQGIIHRDIKPSNILFAGDTHSQAILTDFGLASLADDAQSNLTITGAMVGTPTYMSPEAVLGEPCDARSDLYSLGVVLYEMVTGKPPYTANTPYSMMMKQTTEPLPSPRTLDPAVPEVVETLLLKALAKDPIERFQSAAELAGALNRAQQLLCGEQASQNPTYSRVCTASPPTLQTAPELAGAWVSLSLALSGIVIAALLTVELLLHL